MGKEKERIITQQGAERPGGLSLPVLLLCVLLLLCGPGCGREEILLEAAQSNASVSDGLVMETAAEEESSEMTEEIYVHVCGAVMDPGLKRVLAGSRVWDCLEQAGGFTQEADCDSVNLAATVQDGQQLYFPSKEESATAKAVPDDRIDLNTADEKALQTLPGIGSSKAKAILRYREEKGFFQSTEELMEVSGISGKVYDQIKDQVKVN